MTHGHLSINLSWESEHPGGLPTSRPFPEGYEPPLRTSPPPYALRSIKFAEHVPLDRSENSSKTTVAPVPSKIIPVLRSPPPATPSFDHLVDEDETVRIEAEIASEPKSEPAPDLRVAAEQAGCEVICNAHEREETREDMLRSEAGSSESESAVATCDSSALTPSHSNS